MSKQPIDFAQVESLRRHMLFTIKDVCKFFNVSRQTYYNWQAGMYPKPVKEAVVRAKVRQLLYALVELKWPTPQAIAADAKDRYTIFLQTLGEDE